MADLDDLPEPAEEEPRRARISWVWLVPLLAVAISVAAVWETYRDQGPLIVVRFPSASGIEAGKTPVRYRDVQVGLVEDVRFSDDLTAVETEIRIDRDIAPFVDADAQFWLVEPRVSARGVTGLTTVLSGVYIEGVWDSEAGAPREIFDALRAGPLARPGEAGTRVVLRTRQGGQLASGAPVLFNGIEVGRLGEPQLSETGSSVTIEAFIEVPHDARLTTNTRFWDTSGVSLNLGADGLSVNVESLASLIEGGVTFGTLVTGGEPVTDGHEFSVFASQSEARTDAFEGPKADRIEVAVLLPADEIRLGTGALVRFQGVRVGEVTDITGYVDPARPGRGVQMLVSFSVETRRIGLRETATQEERRAALAERVAGGLRVRVASEGLLGTTLILELYTDPDAPEARLDTETLDLPLLPGGPPSVTDSSESLDGLVDRVSALPIEELMTSAVELMDSLNVLATNPETQALPANANALVTEARAVVSAEEIGTTLASLEAAAADLQALAAQVSGSEGLATALAALESTDAIVADAGAFTATLPDLAETLSAFGDRLAGLPLESLAADAAAAAGRIDTLLADDSVAQIAPSLSQSLTRLEGLLASVEEAGLVGDLDVAIAEISSAATELQTASAELPGLLEDIDAVVAEIGAVPFADVAASVDRVVKRTETILNADGIEDLPGSLDGALGELEATLAELREGGVVETLTATLASAETAFAAIEGATAELPALVTRLDRVAAGLGAVARDYAADSRIYGEIRGAIRDITATADAFRSLARTIERNPSSLLTGR